MLRAISKTIPCKMIMGGAVQRLCGTVDIDGKGTEFELHDLDPFLLADFARLPRGKLPPFGAHPHSGMSAATVLLYGDHVKPWDNLHGSTGLTEVGGVYFINSGKGVVHSEGELVENTDYTGTEAVSSQIWINPGLHLEEPTASSQFVKAADIPVIQGEGFRVRIVLGEYIGQKSPCDTFHADVAILRVQADKGCKGVLRLKPEHTNGMVVVVNKDGYGVFGADSSKVASGEVALLSSEGALPFTNEMEEELEFLVLAGKPFGVKPLKLLGSHGGLMGMDEEGLRAKMKAYEADPDNFGK